ncbi:ArgP/LysG family DNA-binding transcriptional regulator [Lampropedia puyangensis]|uniref:ArgP/LysG family DNA-binding transcriptional regulator n=1 Tax=Lampropedia puyangensis TaxID=1330072 RepID=A0A4S8ERS1_9BURK|nr:HTH-type transcriptional regulator ArgP [Lampropedia puyangensis]THT97457.1 ArgP/LysG family DNA-binding transcriptional regulator [Lampropedia puyangensis]
MIDQRQAQAFLAIAEHRSFAAAAQQLSISLAAVSLRIRAMEAAMGQRLVVRGKQVRMTAAGQVVLAHLKQVELMQADVLAQLAAGSGGASQWRSLAVAVNADSLATWFLPGVEAAMRHYQLVLDIAMDDQDFTHAALKSGDVSGCVSTLAEPLRGCIAQPLGLMRYHCVARADVVAVLRQGANGQVTRKSMRQIPAIIFNRRDGLQDAFLRMQFGADMAADYPKHFIPSTEAYEMAIEQGWGWGMVSSQQLTKRGTHRPMLQDVVEGAVVDVPLYWHHWEREAPAAQRLTKAVVEAARHALLPMQ